MLTLLNLPGFSFSQWNFPFLLLPIWTCLNLKGEGRWTIFSGDQQFPSFCPEWFSGIFSWPTALIVTPSSTWQGPTSGSWRSLEAAQNKIKITKGTKTSPKYSGFHQQQDCHKPFLFLLPLLESFSKRRNHNDDTLRMALLQEGLHRVYCKSWNMSHETASLSVPSWQLGPGFLKQA